MVAAENINVNNLGTIKVKVQMQKVRGRKLKGGMRN